MDVSRLTDAASAFGPGVESAVMAALADLVEQKDWSSSSAGEFLGAQFDAGLAWVQFPIGLGGLNAPVSLQAVVQEKLAALALPHLPPTSSIGYGMCAPALVAWGTETQKQRYLRRLYTGEEIWCQLFSEPSAGSDVAGLGTSARRQGDHWLVSGQKVWTSYGHLARWGLLVARTDPNLDKHAGLSAFILDMEQQHVEVRPLYQITGEAQFNEVFLDDARVEVAQQLGEPGQGWSVALTTLMNERVAIGGKSSVSGRSTIAPILGRWQAMAASDRNPGDADRIVDVWIRAELLRLTNIRHAAAQESGDPGPIGSVVKVATAELNQDAAELWLDMEGHEGLVFDYDNLRDGATTLRQTAQYTFLRSRANSIEGGTSEVMRNIIGERLLGLPAEPRVDRKIPWRDIPRG